MTKQFYAHGKLLLTSEYAVLKGVEALAIPCKRGQQLVYNWGGEHLHWQSKNVQNEIWFEATFDAQAQVVKSSDRATAEFLQNLLQAALNGAELPSGEVFTQLEFERNWGLGSSSTLTSLIAQWLNCSAINLLFETQNGSGYDVVCAEANTPILYKRKAANAEYKLVNTPSIFKETYFVHLNKKQNSRPAVAQFLEQEIERRDLQNLEAIASQFLTVGKSTELQELFRQHEAILANWLDTPTVQNALFNDFDGAVKSLGAWGGDFVWACGKNVVNYFKAKGYHTIIPYNQMALTPV